MELEDDKRRLALLQGEATKRREERDTKFASKSAAAKKKSKSLDSSIKGSEKYRSMEEHRIELEELFQKLEVNPEKVRSLNKNTKSHQSRVFPMVKLTKEI